MIMNLRVLILILNVSFVADLAFSREKSVIIGFKQEPSASEKAMILRSRGVIERTYQVIPAMAARLPEEAIDQLRKNSKVAYIEEGAVYVAAADNSAATTGQYDPVWGIPHISAHVAHAKGNKGKGVRVAILDTGIDYTHEDLSGNYRGGYDYVFDDNDPFDDSFDSHGTHVAGIVAAQDNGIGIIGVAPEVDLYAVKVLDGAGFGTEQWIISGIEWAVRNEIDVINLSLEGPHRQSLQDACDKAYDAGILLVAAGGNGLAKGGPVGCPAAYDSVIAATATDANDLVHSFVPIGEPLELTAPGVDILSTITGGGYDYLSGTSAAAPHVAGAAALCILTNMEDLSGDGFVNHEDVRLMLQLTATDLGEKGKDDVYGYGLVNAGRASGLDVILTITRTPGPPMSDTRVVEVAGEAYGLVIANFGLGKVMMDVFEGELLREDLSGTIYFRDRMQQQVVLDLDATGTHYTIFLTPYGWLDTYAEIVLTTDIQKDGE